LAFYFHIFYISVHVHHIWKQEVDIKSNTRKRGNVSMSAPRRLQVSVQMQCLSLFISEPDGSEWQY